MCEQEPIKESYRLQEDGKERFHEITYEQYGLPCWRSFLHTSNGNVVCYPRRDNSPRKDELCFPYFETEPVLHEDEEGGQHIKYKFSLILNGLTDDEPISRNFTSEPLFSIDEIPQDEEGREELWKKLKRIHKKLLKEINKVWRERSWDIKCLYDVEEDAARPGHDEMERLREDYYRLSTGWEQDMKREKHRSRNNPGWLNTLNQVHGAGLHPSIHAYTQDSYLPRLDINIPLARELTESLRGECIATKCNLFFSDKDVEGIANEVLHNTTWLSDNFGPKQFKGELPEQGWCNVALWTVYITQGSLTSIAPNDRNLYHPSKKGRENLKALIEENKHFKTFRFETSIFGEPYLDIDSAKLVCEETEGHYRFTASSQIDSRRELEYNRWPSFETSSFIDKQGLIEKHGPDGYIKFHLFLTCMFRLYPLAPFQYLYRKNNHSDDKKILQKMTDRSLKLFNILTKDGKDPDSWKFVAQRNFGLYQHEVDTVNILPTEEHPELKIFEL